MCSQVTFSYASLAGGVWLQDGSKAVIFALSGPSPPMGVPASRFPGESSDRLPGGMAGLDTSIAPAWRLIGNNLTCKLSFDTFQIRASNSLVLGHSHVCVLFEALPSTSAPRPVRERSLLLSLHCVPFRFLLFSKAIKSTLIAWPRMLFQLHLKREEVLTPVSPWVPPSH